MELHSFIVSKCALSPWQVEDFSFSLEAVKQLSPFLDGVPQNPRFLGVDADVLCSNPNLPEDFVKICGTPQSPKVFHALATISRSPHICEICANVACSGC
uniref:Guanylin n=1 Tax=Salvator merianae TaxID=96440 RepID=A0A8D0BI25_SALMN